MFERVADDKVVVLEHPVFKKFIWGLKYQGARFVVYARLHGLDPGLKGRLSHPLFYGVADLFPSGVGLCHDINIVVSN